MTLEDAFWSADIARRPLADIKALLEGYRADIDGWLAGVGVGSTARTRRIATAWLDVQPAATVRAQARAVVQATGDPAYLHTLERLLDGGPAVHLVAGERSLAGWHVPDRVRRGATSFTVVPRTGHLMMLESPDAFARAVLEPLSGRRPRHANPTRPGRCRVPPREEPHRQ